MTDQAPEVPEEQPWFLVAAESPLLLRVTPDLVVGETSAGALALNDPRPGRRWIAFTVSDDGTCWVELASAQGEMTGPAGERVPRYPLSHGLTLALPGNTLYVSRNMDLPAADGPVLQVSAGGAAEEEVAAPAADRNESPDDQPDDQPEIVSFLNQLREQLGMEPPPGRHGPGSSSVQGLELPLPERLSSAMSTELPPRDEQATPPLNPAWPASRPPPVTFAGDRGAGHAARSDPPRRPRPYRSQSQSNRVLDTLAVLGTLILAALATLLTVAPSGELAQRLGVDVLRPWAAATLQSIRGEETEASRPAADESAHALEPALARATSVLESSSAADGAPSPRPVPVMEPVVTVVAPVGRDTAPGDDSAGVVTEPPDWRLVRARQFMAEGEISKPSGQNAVAMLTSLLADEPGNDAARMLLEECSNRLIDAATSYHDRGLEYEARNTLEEVLSFKPDDPEANRLWREWVKSVESGGPDTVRMNQQRPI